MGCDMRSGYGFLVTGGIPIKSFCSQARESTLALKPGEVRGCFLAVHGHTSLFPKVKTEDLPVTPEKVLKFFIFVKILSVQN